MKYIVFLFLLFLNFLLFLSFFMNKKFLFTYVKFVIM